MIVLYPPHCRGQYYNSDPAFDAPQWFWWHLLIIAHKGGIVFVKVFLDQSFWQAPLGLLVTVTVVMLQAAARPFESAALDRLQSVCLWVEIIFITCGLLFNTELGTPELPDGRPGKFTSVISALFFFFLFGTVILSSYFIYNDLKRFKKMKHIRLVPTEKELDINPKHFILRKLYPWLCSAPEHQLDAFREMSAIRKKYLPLPHLKSPYLFLAKAAPCMLGWICWPVQDQQADISFGQILKHFIAVQEGLDAPDSDDEDCVSELPSTPLGIPSYILADYKSMQISEIPEWDIRGNSLVEQLFKEHQWGAMLYTLSECTRTEHYKMVSALGYMVYGMNYVKLTHIWAKVSERRVWNKWRVHFLLSETFAQMSRCVLMSRSSPDVCRFHVVFQMCVYFT